MGAKENLNEAMFSIFGVGKAPEAQEAEAAPAPAVEKKEVPAAKAAPAAEKKPATYLAPGSHMEGKLQCQGDVHVAGIFKGDIDASGKVAVCANVTGNIHAENLEITDCRLVGDVVVSGTVTLDAKAYVEGKITAGELICAGHVKGDLDVKGHVSLKSNTTVEGNITTGAMDMEVGAIINGSLTMNAGKK